MPTLTALLFLTTVVAASAVDSTYVIKPVRVFTGDLEDPVLEDMAVMVRGDRVAVVAPVGRMVVPAAAMVVDGEGKTLLPGFIDLHVHLAGTGSRFDHPFTGWPSLHPRQALACGVTTVLDLNAEDGFIRAMKGPRAVGDELSVMPTVLASLAAVTCASGHGTERGFPARVLLGEADALTLVDGLLAAGADFMKVMYDGGGWAGHPTRPMLSEAELRALLRAADERGLRVIVHAVKVSDMRSALAAGAAAIAHAPAVGDVDASLVAAFLEHDAALISTLVAYEASFDAGSPRSLGDRLAVAYVPAPVLEGFRQAGDLVDPSSAALRERFGSILSAVGALHEAGVRVLAGTDAGTPGTWHGVAIHRELELLVHAGLTPREALRSATGAAAEFLNRTDLGQVAPGRRADLVLVEGRPDEAIRATRAIHWVMVGGRVVDREQIQRQTAESSTSPPPRPDHQILLGFESEPANIPWSVSTNGGDSHATAMRMADLNKQNPGTFLRLQGEVVPSPPTGGFARLEHPVSVSRDGSNELLGIRFRARATPRARFRVQIGTSAVKDGDDFVVELPVEGDWREYRLPFDAFAQVGFGKRVRYRTEDILTIAWMTGVGVEGAFQIDLDDVGWYR